jgi:hypothetical protein
MMMHDNDVDNDDKGQRRIFETAEQTPRGTQNGIHQVTHSQSQE